MANHALDLAGQKFGKLTAVRIITRTPKITWLCDCECGGTKNVPASQLPAGMVKSCGCLLFGEKDTWKKVVGLTVNDWKCIEFLGTSKYGHRFLWEHACGRTIEKTKSEIKAGKVARCRCTPRVFVSKSIYHTPTRNTHRSMIARCLNQQHVGYRNYGGRGITVDPKWLNYRGFVEDMGERPDGFELGRTNNDGDYCKENCQWVSRKANLRNTSVNCVFEFDDKDLCVAEIAEMAEIPYHRAWARLTKYGFSVKQTLRGYK
jgi:hypothetical protein